MKQRKKGGKFRKLPFMRRGGDFFITFLILTLLVSNGVLYYALGINAQVPPSGESFPTGPGSSFTPPDTSTLVPQECQSAGIFDPTRCQEYMKNKALGQDSSRNGPVQDAAAECPADCGQCKACRGGQCLNKSFGESDARYCGAGKVCDGYGGCVEVRSPENLGEEQQRLLEKFQGISVPKEEVKPQSACGQCGQCKICLGTECVKAPFGASDPLCGNGQVCDGYGGCVSVTKTEDLSRENRRLFEQGQRENRGEAAGQEGQRGFRGFSDGPGGPGGFPPDFSGRPDFGNFPAGAAGQGGSFGPTGPISDEEGGKLRGKCEELGLTTQEACMEYFQKREHAPQGDFSSLLPRPCQENNISEPSACIAFMKEQFSGAGQGPGGPGGPHEGEGFGPPQGFGPPGRFGPGGPSEGGPGGPGEGFGPPGEFGGPDFASFLPPDCVGAGITDPAGCQNLMFSLNMPDECRDNPSIKTPKDCEKHMFKKFAPPICQKFDTPQECETAMISEHLPPDCKQAGVKSPEECHKYMASSMMPKVCADQGATNEFECEKIVFATYGRPEGCQGLSDTECRIAVQEGRVEADELLQKLDKELSPRCRELGAKDFRECEKLTMDRNFPPECRAEGAFTPQACERVMMEKFAPKPDQFPRPCQEAGATTQEACERVMTARFMPRDCKNNGITTREQCEEFLARKNMPKECVDAGAFKREECEKIMRSKYMAPLCKEQGINDEETCKQFMHEKFAKKYQCDGLSSEECEISIKKRHLGQILQKEDELKEVKEEIGKVVGRHLALGRRGLTPGRDEGEIPGPPETQPPSPEGQTAQEARGESVSEQEASEQIIFASLPLVLDQETAVLVVPSEEINTITEDEVIISTLGAAITFDDDQDGVPNDIEERLGSDPNISDSDGDGFADGEEVHNNFNPAGEGALAYDLHPIEESIFEGETLEQPISSGDVNEQEFVIEGGDVVHEDGSSEPLPAAQEPSVQAPPAESTPTEGQAPPTSRLKSFLAQLIRPVLAKKQTAAQAIKLRGRAERSTIITLFIYSEVSIIATAKTDAQGNWAYTMDKQLTDGEHTVYVATTDRNGKIVQKSNPFSFLIKGARAVTPQEFLAPTSAEQPKGPSMTILWLSLLGFIVVVAAGGGIAVAVKRKRGV